MVFVQQHVLDSFRLFGEKKIPEYYMNYKNEFMYIIGINKTCHEFLQILNEEEIIAEGFDTPQARRLIMYMKRFLKAQEIGYLKDVTGFCFRWRDVIYIDKLETAVCDYLDLYYDENSCQFDQQKYDSEYPALREFNECLKRFMEKLKKEDNEEEEYNRFIEAAGPIGSFDWIDSDSDSDSDEGPTLSDVLGSESESEEEDD